MNVTFLSKSTFFKGHMYPLLQMIFIFSWTYFRTFRNRGLIILYLWKQLLTFLKTFFYIYPRANSVLRYWKALCPVKKIFKQKLTQYWANIIYISLGLKKSKSKCSIIESKVLVYVDVSMCAYVCMHACVNMKGWEEIYKMCFLWFLSKGW